MDDAGSSRVQRKSSNWHKRRTRFYKFLRTLEINAENTIGLAGSRLAAARQRTRAAWPASHIYQWLARNNLIYVWKKKSENKTDFKWQRQQLLFVTLYDVCVCCVHVCMHVCVCIHLQTVTGSKNISEHHALLSEWCSEVTLVLSCNSEKEKKALANSAHPTTKQVWQFQQLCWWLLDAVVLYKISCDSVKDYNMLQADDVEIVFYFSLDCRPD